MIFFHRWLNKYTIPWRFVTIYELWNSIIFLNFKTSLVITPRSPSIIMKHCVQKSICDLSLNCMFHFINLFFSNVNFKLHYVSVQTRCNTTILIEIHFSTISYIQSWTKDWRQIHKIKQKRFFYGLFYSWFFPIFFRKTSKFGFWVSGWVLAIKSKHFRDLLEIS